SPFHYTTLFRSRPTSRASFKAGIHLGWTNEEYSISFTPVSDNILIQATFSEVLTQPDSFCKPSLGPTSFNSTSFVQRIIEPPHIIQLFVHYIQLFLTILIKE